MRGSSLCWSPGTQPLLYQLEALLAVAEPGDALAWSLVWARATVLIECLPLSCRPWSMASPTSPVPWHLTLNFESWQLAPSLGLSRCILQGLSEPHALSVPCSYSWSCAWSLGRCQESVQPFSGDILWLR